MRYRLLAFSCVMTLATATAVQVTSGGDDYTSGGMQPRDSRADCNNNGIADEIELGPLDGHALLFDGVDDLVDPGSSATALAELGQGDFTLETWIWSESTSHAVIMGNCCGVPHFWNFVKLEGGNIRITFGDGVSGADCVGTISVADGVWHHVAAVRWVGPTGNLQIYIDGVLDVEVAAASVPFTADNPTSIGRDAREDLYYLDAALDDLRVWNVARTGTEIAADMYSVLDGTEPGLVAYWRFDEGTGLTAYDSAGDNDGTLVGPPTWVAMGEDCNESDVLDECDLADGTSQDCNTNSVPDECDIAAGTSVDSDGDGIPDECEHVHNITQGTLHVTIQEGIDAAVAGDEIEVGPGTYVERINLQGKAITLRSSDGPDITIIDGDEDGSVITCANQEGPDTIIEGFTITNGTGTSIGAGAFVGGGMFNDGASPTVTNCTFSGNSALCGGGMFNFDSDSNPTLTNCVFSANSAAEGGGMSGNYQSSPVLINCTFNGNASSGFGGGMYLNGSSSTLTNCTFSGNVAVSGGGMFNNNNDSSTLTNCTFSRNSAGNGGGMYNLNSNPTLTNCILWGNTGSQIHEDNSTTAATYSCIQGGWAGVGNIDADPLFVDAVSHDVHLLEGSPCINAGDDSAVPVDLTTDLDGDDRIQHCRVDMGADETPFIGPDCNTNSVSDACDIADGTSVDSDANGVPDECERVHNITQGTIHVTIQDAIDAAVAGDEIEVRPGTYVERINLLGKGITLRSTDGPDVTIIDGAAGGSVITCSNEEGPDTIIEGFTVTNGDATHGGGMYNDDTSPTLTNCTFSGNTALSGGGMHNAGGSPTLTNCTFSGNGADYTGGGMTNGNASPILTNCTFSGNSASYGGGGMLNEHGSSPTLANCTFSGNSAEAFGGGMYSYDGNPTLANCIFWGNTATTDPQVHDRDDATTTATYSCIQGGWDGVGNIDADPLFVDADGPDGVFGTEDDDLHLQEESPCINAGDDEAVPPGVTTDFEGDDRIQQCRVDMGVDETPYYHGEFTDCNNNGVLDECDIDAGTSQDCNGNGVPDECETGGEEDCNTNGVADLCDIYDGTSQDCNGNGIPDECDIADGTSPDENPAPDGIPDECQGVPAVKGACCLSCACIVATEPDCLAAGGAYQGDGTTCEGVECSIVPPGDMDGDGDVDGVDIQLFVDALLYG